MKKIKEYFDLNKNPNIPFFFVGIIFLVVGIFLKEMVWIALACFFIILSGTTYQKPKK